MMMQFNSLKAYPKLTHAVTTTRFAGIDPFNLADHIGPARSQAIENRKRLCQALGLSFERLTVSEQVHRGQVAIVDVKLIGRGASGRADAIGGCDGLITSAASVPLMALSADCPLLLIYDPSRNVLATVHASWRALADGIIANVIDRFADDFNCERRRLIAGLSPSAGPCCYEVADDFCDCISKVNGLGRFIVSNDDGRSKHYDLWQASVWSLTQAGLAETNIEVMGLCTICDCRFFSYRRQGLQAGRFALIAAIR